jgi:ABC-type antimicrobial peptide transport system permease subunit
MSPEAVSVLRIAIGVRGNPESFAARLRAVASEVEPALQIHDLMRLDEAGANMWLGSQYMSRVMAVLSGLALLLSLTAIYSVMAFTVTQRAREIGIRMALGADRRHIIGAILRRPLAQVSAGIAVGAVLVAGVFFVLVESTPTVTESALIAAYSALMMVVCLLACIVPTLRALRIEPARVLAVEG